MRKTCIRLFTAALLGVPLAGAASTPADAGSWGRGHYRHWGGGHWHGGHSSFVLGLNFLVPLYRYPPAYYYDAPPRVVYVEPRRAPVCRQFRGDATVDANGRRFFGTACLEADGRWHIVD